MDTKIKITMTPQAIERLEEDMENDKLQEFLDDLQKQIDDGTFFDNSEAVDMELLKEEEPELYEELMQAMEGIEGTGVTLN